MEFPRIKKFTFNIMTTYKIPSYHVGRLDLISIEFYNNVRMYKSIAAANDIKLSHGCRVGIRPQPIAIKNELIMKGYSGNALESEYNRIMNNTRTTELDWFAYENTSYGYISNVYEDKLLLIPDLASADLYLQQYEYLEV